MKESPAEQPAAGGSPKLAEELRKMKYEPLLAIEKKLIWWSIGLGVAALGVLIWLSETFF